MNIPTLQTQTVAPVAVAVAATFAAFKIEDQISFVRDYSPTVQAIEGYRHAVLRYRNTDTKAVQKTTKMVTVPQLVLPEEYSLLDERAQKVILGLFEDEQDNIMRNLIDEKGASYIGWSLVLLDCVLASLTAVRISQRLTKEQIENWFKIAALEVCTKRADQISEAKSFNEEQKKAQAAGTLTAYCNLAMKLAAPVPNLGQNEATALQNLLILANLDDDMAKVLKAKLYQMLHPKVVENVDL